MEQPKQENGDGWGEDPTVMTIDEEAGKPMTVLLDRALREFIDQYAAEDDQNNGSLDDRRPSEPSDPVKDQPQIWAGFAGKSDVPPGYPLLRKGCGA